MVVLGCMTIAMVGMSFNFMYSTNSPLQYMSLSARVLVPPILATVPSEHLDRVYTAGSSSDRAERSKPVPERSLRYDELHIDFDIPLHLALFTFRSTASAALTRLHLTRVVTCPGSEHPVIPRPR